MRVKAVIFDLDGTLIDSRKDIAMAANRALEELGLPTLPENTIARFIGGGAELLIKQCLGEVNKHRFNEVLELYKKNYNDGCINYTVLYPGVKEVLDFLKLRGIIIALATNKSISFSRKILEYFQIDEYFSIMLGPDDVKNRKPHPEIVNAILKKIKVLPEETLYVGDSELDILCGQNAGTYTCAVTYGIGLLENLNNARPDFLLCDLNKLALILK